jgi:hypothetical protein
LLVATAPLTTAGQAKETLEQLVKGGKVLVGFDQGGP